MPTLPSPGATLTGAALRPLTRRVDHMGMAVPTHYTADMVRALPDDGNRYETVHGELLVTPAPRLDHQYVITELVARLHPSRSEEHTSELQSLAYLVCRLLL